MNKLERLQTREFVLILEELRFTLNKDGGRLVLPEGELGFEDVPEGQPSRRYMTFTLEELVSLRRFLDDVIPLPPPVRDDQWYRVRGLSPEDFKS